MTVSAQYSSDSFDYTDLQYNIVIDEQSPTELKKFLENLTVARTSRVVAITKQQTLLIAFHERLYGYLKDVSYGVCRKESRSD